MLNMLALPLASLFAVSCYSLAIPFRRQSDPSSSTTPNSTTVTINTNNFNETSESFNNILGSVYVATILVNGVPFTVRNFPYSVRCI